MTNAFRRWVLLTGAYVLAAAPCYAGDFPVRNAETAIAIAKEKCDRQIVVPSDRWRAELSGDAWHARAPFNADSITGLDVTIPVNGPAGECILEVNAFVGPNHISGVGSH